MAANRMESVLADGVIARRTKTAMVGGSDGAIRTVVSVSAQHLTAWQQVVIVGDVRVDWLLGQPINVPRNLVDIVSKGVRM